MLSGKSVVLIFALSLVTIPTIPRAYIKKQYTERTQSLETFLDY